MAVDTEHPEVVAATKRWEKTQHDLYMTVMKHCSNCPNEVQVAYETVQFASDKLFATLRKHAKTPGTITINGIDFKPFEEYGAYFGVWPDGREGFRQGLLVAAMYVDGRLPTWEDVGDCCVAGETDEEAAQFVAKMNAYFLTELERPFKVADFPGR